MIYWIGFIIIAICAAIIIFIIVRKIPKLRIIDVDSMVGEKQAKIKEELLWQRVARKVKERSEPLIGAGSDIKKNTQGFLTDLQDKAKNLEQRYAAERRASKPIKVKPGTEDKLSNLLEEAKRLAGEDNLAEAEEKYIEVISLDHHNVGAYQGLANIYIKNKNYIQAKETLDFIVKMGKADEKTYSMLGEISYKDGSYKEAEEYYKIVLGLNKNIAQYHIDLAKVYISMENRENAQRSLKNAHEIEPKNPKTLDLLLENSIILGNKDEAKEYLKEFKILNPENPKLDEWKSKIKDL